MSLYQKVLVAVDSSEEAIQVLQAAGDVPGIENASVEVIHVAEKPQAAYGQWIVYLPISESDLQEKLLERLEQRVKASGLKAGSVRVEFGRASDRILEEAGNQHTDLIVVGSHGRHGIKLVLGSTANAILHRAKCDVLAVRIAE